MKRASRREGFTLIELMVALVTGLIAVSALYALTAGSARHLQEQQRVAQAQMSLRMAVPRLRGDLARAGLFGTPSSDAVDDGANTAGCPRPSPPVVAVELLDDPDSARFPEFEANGVHFDRIRLVGNYATSGSYMIVNADSASSVRLQASWQGFRRDFVDATDDRISVEAFAAAFAPGRYLHIRTLNQTSVFTRIARPVYVSDSELHVEVLDPMPIHSICMPGLGDGATVAPLSRIEYAVVDPRDPASELDALAGEADVALEDRMGLRPAVLVRREIPFGCQGLACVPIPGTTEPILEMIAELDFRVVIDQSTEASAAPDLVVTGDPAVVAAHPERVRSIVFRLSVRTAGTDPRFAYLERGDGEALTRFQASPQAPGASRVRTVETEVFLPNLVPSPSM
jgi:prepilin-type N-terminal cleavage/methylation domain-containing protein